MNQKLSFVKRPNLPERDVALAAMSGTYPFLSEALQKQGVEILEIPPASGIADPVSSHADMVCHHLGDREIFVLRSEQNLAAKLETLRFQIRLTEKYPRPEYPFDVLLNAARVGERVLLHPDYVDPCFFRNLQGQGAALVPVKQGYVKCSCAVISEHAVITSDPGIYQAAVQNQIDVLLVSPGNILLKGYPYGFLGGCCGLIGPKKLAFTGSLKNHPDSPSIMRFLEKLEVETVFLSDGPLLDIGGILPLKEYG